MSNRESLLLRFRELHDYVRLMGEHVNQIHSHLDNIEKKIDEITKEQASSAESAKVEFESLRELMTTKSELEGLLMEINDTIKGALPTLHNLALETQPQEAKESVEVQKEESVAAPQQELAKEAKKKRFSFFSRFFS